MARGVSGLSRVFEPRCDRSVDSVVGVNPEVYLQRDSVGSVAQLLCGLIRQAVGSFLAARKGITDALYPLRLGLHSHGSLLGAGPLAGLIWPGDRED